MHQQRNPMLKLASLLAITAVLAACSGTASPYVGPAATPTPGTSGSLTTSTSSSVNLPSLLVSGYTVTGSVPVANVATSISETLSTSAPSGVTPLVRVRHQAVAQAESVTDLIYVTLTAQAAVTLTQSPAFTFTSSSISSGTSYSLAENVGGTWTAPFAGPVTASGNSVSFASVNTPVTITPTAPVTFVLYTGTAVTPTPSPTPTPVPTPVASPSTLVFDANSPSTQTFTVSEMNYAGAFNASMACTENPANQSPGSNAFVAQFTGGATTATQTAASAGAPVTFSVDGGAETGSCAVTVSDSAQHAITVTVDVSTSSVIISGHPR